MNFSEWFAMGGYGVFVWPAYFITVGVFGINLLLALREKKRVQSFIQHYLNQQHES